MRNSSLLEMARRPEPQGAEDSAPRDPHPIAIPLAGAFLRLRGEGERGTPSMAATLHGAFAAQAARTPGAVAVTGGGEALTYAELDARSDALARRLRAEGVVPGAHVGICAERSPSLVVAILGALKAGAAYVPLEPHDPPDRLAYVAGDAGVRVVLAHTQLRERLPAGVERVVWLDGDDVVGGSHGGHGDHGEVDPRSLAYVIYTSGSTGRPKGVGVTHANVLRLFTTTDAGFGFGADDVWTLFHSYAFDFSVWEIWGALLYGGRLVVVPYVVARAPEDFYALLEMEGVTVLNQTPSAFRALMRVDEEAHARGGMRPLALRTVVFGGEALDPATLRGWVRRRGIARPRLVNMYGITETTVHVTWRTLTRGDVEAGGASPIGVPIPDLSAHVLDPAGEPRPEGETGELYVGGAGLARGYLGRPALTAQRFVPDPFSGVPGARLYRSGDLARRLPGGGLEYLGRIDDQVKLRGFRIELGEIEGVLREHPSVADAVVLVQGEGAEARLVAWIVPARAPAEGTLPRALRAWARSRLPDYMMPSAIHVLDRLPLTRNGKVDRGALLAR